MESKWKKWWREFWCNHTYVVDEYWFRGMMHGEYAATCSKCGKRKYENMDCRDCF